MSDTLPALLALCRLATRGGRLEHSRPHLLAQGRQQGLLHFRNARSARHVRTPAHSPDPGRVDEGERRRPGPHAARSAARLLQSPGQAGTGTVLGLPGAAPARTGRPAVQSRGPGRGRAPLEDLRGRFPAARIGAGGVAQGFSRAATGPPLGLAEAQSQERILGVAQMSQSGSQILIQARNRR
jgi:hypothetical protein